jgi:O-antigen/teichoic acid export membrane protein
MSGLLGNAPVQRIFTGLRSGGTYWMLVGSFIAALGAYLFQVITTRSLDEVRYAPIGTLWTIQYLTVSIFVYSVETYVTRGSLRAEAGTGPGAVSLAKIWAALVVVALGIFAFSWWFRDRLFQGQGELAVIAGCLVVAFGALMIVRGRLAGSGRFKAYGLVTASESLCRLLFALGVAAVGASTRTFAWVMPFGALAAASWWPLLKRSGPESGSQVLSAKPAGTLRFLALTTSANASTQLLLAGGPILLAFLHASPAEISVFFITVTAARLPVVFVFGGILSRLLGTFVRLAGADHGRSLRRAAAWIAVGTGAVAFLGGASAAAIGSRLIGLLFGQAFLPPWWVAAGATVGVLLATGSMVLSQMLVATGSEAQLPWPWGSALIGSGLTIAVASGSPLGRVVAGFIVGEAIALIGLTVAVLYGNRGDVAVAATDATEPFGLGPQPIGPS